ncbi:hypothetical protein EXN61_21650 [Agrobacterium tumefaciens]|uniref:Uncharacterized protein n=1 Tax=Agrobacterium tumefaciens TaxID=358 RepID=A0A546XRU7_AGRTU|nr:hypothetical protein [Agrobacterium tumefaciens]TRB03470.1 hypothetical protein EXN61_21650 [Agrobacterium tumefaciens]
MTFYEEMRDVAEEMLAEFGMTGAIRRTVTSGPDYDPDITETDYACTLVILEIDISKIDGTLIQQGDRMVYVSTKGLTIEVTVSDKLVIAGKEHVIKQCRPLSPAGLTVYYELIIAS